MSEFSWAFVLKLEDRCRTNTEKLRTPEAIFNIFKFNLTAVVLSEFK